ncbi:hypothetical protein PSQ19_06095 [Devosia algicola]|uniref:Uncharacterized protein n=1 Tax=Devosia algicola TaxID=3026418 RepID=A0ABY7YRJ4_9HYPH|nr:hypothetical protein [Devosia algicola]WDR03639.1 hypothetical protein PSQ19_06095 [Devosia algicola]
MTIGSVNDSPRTSRIRSPLVYVETKTNAWAAEIGYLTSAGLSADAIAEALGDGTSPDTIRKQWQKWRFKELGHNSKDIRLRVPFNVKERSLIQFRAADNGLSAVEWLRRLALVVAQERNGFAKLVGDQFY